ncbi:unnamed protein product [Gongylonema pulchrum]|uniref:Uncharacterized protein n=1 Tax=Gongylonema pulchrum TaxID=637853 RepID=A0A3P6SE56_9BILA|nr:unnamed protein product [Gongylonema pulchrum]
MSLVVAPSSKPDDVPAPCHVKHFRALFDYDPEVSVLVI